MYVTLTLKKRSETEKYSTKFFSFLCLQIDVYTKKYRTCQQIKQHRKKFHFFTKKIFSVLIFYHHNQGSVIWMDVIWMEFWPKIFGQIFLAKLILRFN